MKQNKKPKYKPGQIVYFLNGAKIHSDEIVADDSSIYGDYDFDHTFLYLLRRIPYSFYLETELFASPKELQDSLVEEFRKLNEPVTGMDIKEPSKLTQVKDGKEHEFGRDGWQPKKRARGRPKGSVKAIK